MHVGKIHQAKLIIDRFTIAIDAIDRVPKLQVAGAHTKEQLKNRQIECRQYAYTQ